MSNYKIEVGDLVKIDVFSARQIEREFPNAIAIVQDVAFSTYFYAYVVRVNWYEKISETKRRFIMSSTYRLTKCTKVFQIERALADE